MRCAKCHEPGVSGAVYCAKCGERLPAEASSDVKPSHGLEAGRADVPETILWSGRYSPKAMLAAFVATDAMAIAIVIGGVMTGQTAGAVAVALIVLSAPIAALLYRRFATRFRLTNQRLIHERGILQRVTNRIELIAIDDLSFEQGMIDRLTNVGTIHIYAHDSTDPALTMVGVDDVARVFGLIDSGRRAEKLRRGISIDEAHFRHAPEGFDRR